MQSLALPRAVHNPCQRRKMTVSTNNGLVNGPVHNLLMLFHPGPLKIEVFKTGFYDIVITQNDHPRYVKHVLGRIYVYSIAFGKSTSQRIYREQHTPKIGWKLHKYRLKHALHTLDDHFR